MVAGTWYNQDGLPIQYGVQKAIPELGGDYLLYGENREIEMYIPLVNMQFGGILGATPFVPAAPTAFSGSSTYQAAGISSATTLMPLAQFAPVTTVASSQYTFNNSAIFIEQVEVDTLIGAAGGTSINMGLVVTSPGTPSSSFVQLTSSIGTTGAQILNGYVVPTTTGIKSIFTAANGTTSGGYQISTTGTVTSLTTGGGWVGVFSPIPTNAITPLPTSAWFSTIATGTYTAGLIKVRVKYVMFGAINQ